MPDKSQHLASMRELARRKSVAVNGITGPDGQVPVEDYELPIGQAEVVQEGTDDTWLL